MKLTSLGEFYEKSDDKNISLYREYLATAKKDICEGMEEAKGMLGENDRVIEQLNSDIQAIEKLEEIIENSIRELVSNSIAKMSDEELKGIIDNYIEDLQEKKEKLSSDLGELRGIVDTKTQEYTNKMEQLGYKYTYYEKEDAENFFEDIKSAEDYVMGLVKSDLDKEALKATFLWLYSIDAVQEEFANAILSLRKIAKICDDDVLRRAIQNFLTPDKTGKIIGNESQEQCLSMFESLQRILKTRTEFFECLPEALKEEIKNNGVVDNETYYRLKAIYLTYKESGEIITPTNKDVQKSEREIEVFVERIAGLDNKIERAKALCESREKMISLVESFVVVEGNKDLSYKTIATEALELKADQQYIQEQINALNAQLENLEQTGYKISNLLTKVELRENFDILKAKRERKKIEDEKSIYCDKEVANIYEAEKRRLLQFRAVGNLIRTLNSTKKDIEGVNNNRSFWRNATGANQKLRDNFLQKYHNTIKEYYATLDEENLLRINIRSNYIDVEDETINKPANLDELLAKPNLVCHVIDGTLFEEMVNRNLFKYYTTQEGMNHTNEVLYELASKLFKSSKNLDGTYEFEISAAEIDRLVSLQEEFVSLYEAVEFIRNAEKDTVMRLSAKEISEEFKRLISEVGMDLETVTQEDIEEYQEKIERETSQIRRDLFKLQEELPKEEHIDSQYEMLNGLEDTCMSSDEVKKTIQFN